MKETIKNASNQILEILKGTKVKKDEIYLKYIQIIKVINLCLFVILALFYIYVYILFFVMIKIIGYDLSFLFQFKSPCI